LVEPVGLLPSSLAHIRTPGFGDMRGMPTSGVFPIAARMSSYLVTQGVSQREGPRLAKRSEDPTHLWVAQLPQPGDGAVLHGGRERVVRDADRPGCSRVDELLEVRDRDRGRT